jgi:hypothetical protein
MTRPLLALSLGIGAMILAADAAFAQARNCASHDSVTARLAEGYGETRQAIGIGQNSAVIEIFASLETRTWTITVTMPNGPTCVVAAGEGYEALNEALPVPGNPA